MKKKILHIASLDKFIPGFIDLLHQHFCSELHTVMTFGDKKKYPYDQIPNTMHFTTLKSVRVLFRLLLEVHRHDKIILHGLFMNHLVVLLCFMPWLHKRCYWVMWGWDLYYHQLAVKNTHYRFMEVFRKFLISRLGGFVTYVDGDYENAQQWYGAKGKYCECIMYRSNVYSGGELFSSDEKENIFSDKKKVNLLVGNSADPANNHLHVFEKLAEFDLPNLVEKIYCPLSYGDPEYASQIKLKGEMMFGDKFHPLIEFMPLEQYNQILDEIDIAIFAHNRQQGMGNTINLLGRGKTVFMRDGTSSYALLNKLGITVFSLEDLSITIQPATISLENNRTVSDYFSESNLIKQLEIIFT